MARNKSTQNIVIDAIRMLGEFGEQFEQVPPHVETQGIDRMNDLLGYYAATGVNIPFYTTFDLTLNAGQREYVISNDPSSDLVKNPIVEVIFANIVIEGVYWPVHVITSREMFYNIFSEDTKTRPYKLLLERNVDTSKLIFYPNPDQQYTCNIKAKLEFSEIEANDTLTEIPIFWHRYLKYRVAKDLKPFYPGSNWTPEMEIDLRDMEETIKAMATQNADYSFDTGTALLKDYTYGYYRNKVTT
jgi:hypothetical protein